MSLWVCPQCGTLTGPTHGPCPICGTATHYATVERPETSTDVVSRTNVLYDTNVMTPETTTATPCAQCAARDMALRWLVERWRAEYHQPYANGCNDRMLNRCASELEAMLTLKETP